ncbi:hypothetical protein DPSP01_011159 [Paraphaeosphaeria sporulosa]
MSNNADLQLGQVFNVKDKVALVTSGGSSIGLMITQALAVNGAKVYIVGRTEEKLEKVAEVHGKDIAGEIIPLQGDAASKEGVRKFLREVESREKYLDILVNNAGSAPGKTETKHDTPEAMREHLLDPTSVDEWTSVYTTHVVGPFMMTTAFLPYLQIHGYSGTVINITSISGLVKISQDHYSYNASKAAQIHLNRMLSSEIAQMGFKICVNSIAPDVFPSEMTTGESRNDNQKSEMPKEHKEGLPCQYLNGQTIPVDGDYLIQAGQ